MRNGSGTYSLPTNSWSPAVGGAPATASDWQALINDVASALTQSLSKDGQTPLTGDLQMAANKLTALSAGTAAGHSVRYEQIFGTSGLTTLSASGGSALVGFLQSGTGAVATTAQAKMRVSVSVKDFGATGDGSTDDTAAITAAVTAAAGKTLFFPAGTYKVVSALTLSSSIVIKGESPFTTEIKTTSGTADIFTVTAGLVQISGMKFSASVARTAGAYVNFAASSYSSLTNFQMAAPFIGVKIDGGAIIQVGAADQVATIRDTVASTGMGIYVTGTPFSVIISGVQMDADVGSQPLAGIYLDDSADVTISKCGIIHHGNDIYIAPGAGQTVDTIWISDTFLDTAVGGLRIQPSGTGIVNRVRMSNSWTSSHSGNGITIVGSASATISGVHLVDVVCVSNTGTGLSVTDATGLRDLVVNGGQFASNSSGISLASGITEFMIVNATIGRGGGANGNTVNGILCNGTISNCVISGNVLVSNGTNQISFTGAVGAGVFVANNVGYNNAGYASITVGASPYDYTAGYTSETIMIDSGTVSTIAVNGTNVFTGTNRTLTVNAGDVVRVTYSSAPGMAKIRH